MRHYKASCRSPRQMIHPEKVTVGARKKTWQLQKSVRRDKATHTQGLPLLSLSTLYFAGRYSITEFHPCHYPIYPTIALYCDI
ncbi:hypothetical protein BABINDRAFT_118332 [Babjeviella inositovora NRRL Y-12698]|uniref:Uncharacterized protein n=1 Tax=Babjeviella inositovora NRRL Y-12698 TaxID=984486 RepID=A0A1E3QTS6_9ASCO|nr:uncharacterized protein BABINDRAFT_118332 [Babjeviella inositovora NRRL Y-12698]ODQ80944.1 hypothetical protein BABINDRAFT_118332 [Babjeviella inositovora NRRL Y-12698]